MAAPTAPTTVVPGGDAVSLDVRERARRHAGLAGLAFASAADRGGAQQTQARHLAFLPPETLDLDLANPAHRDFGDYELVEKLGQGGMGVVYRARQKSLEREVALKLLAAGPWASNDFIERFRREAQSAARLQHPNIVPIHEIGTHEELNFFSMALVRGASLAQMLARDGPFDPRAAAQLLRTIAEALDYAHQLGVLHLDLKPGNVLVDARGVPLVADFGLARRLDEALVTDNDEVSGTPSYMAPEQAQVRSHRLSPATDIYGLGAILYELLTGQPPFLAATPQETLRKVVSAAPARPRALRRSLPLDLEVVTLKCLAKDPRQRYASARALADDLGRYIDGRAVSVRPLNAAQRLARWAVREPRLAGALGAFVLALAGGLAATAVQWRRADSNASSARANLWSSRGQAAQAALAQGDSFRSLSGLVANLAEMEASGRSAEADLERERIGTLLANSPRLVATTRLPGSIMAVALSSDAKSIAVALSGIDPDAEADTGYLIRQVYLLDADDLRTRWSTPTTGMTNGHRMANFHDIGGLDFTADGRRLIVRLAPTQYMAAPSESDSLALDAATGAPLAMADAPADYAAAVYSDDGSRALLRFRVGSAPAWNNQDVQSWQVAPWKALGPRKRMPTEWAEEWLIAPDGSWLLGTGEYQRFALYDPATLAQRWRLEFRGTGLRATAWRGSADGRWIALGHADGSVHLLDAATGAAQLLPGAAPERVTWLEFSRDGATLAAFNRGGRVSAWDVRQRQPRAAPVTTGAGLRDGLGLRLAGDWIFAAGDDRLMRWHLPPIDPFVRFNRDPVVGTGHLRHPAPLMGRPFDVAIDAGLVASGAADGTLSLWRLPPPALKDARAAPLPGARLDFDGVDLVAVDGNSAQVVDALSEAPRSVRFVHDVPVRHAALSADAATLVTVAGRTVRVLDRASGALRGDPIVLPQTPLRVTQAAAAPLMVLTTGEYAGDVLYERLHFINLQRGRLLAQEARVPGPLRSIQIAGDGSLLFAIYERDNGTEGVDPTVLVGIGREAPCARLDLGPQARVVSVAAAGNSLPFWVYAIEEGRKGRMLRFDASDCRILTDIAAPYAGSPVLLPAGDGVIATRMPPDRILRFAADGTTTQAPGIATFQSMRASAASRDGRWAAMATRNAVQVADLERGERLSPLLAAPIGGDDAIAQMAFSPDGSRLLARTVMRRWIVWDLPRERRAASELVELARRLDPAPEGADGEPAPLPVAAHREPAGTSAPAADARTWGTVELAAAAAAQPDPRFERVDLATVANAPLHAQFQDSDSYPGDLPTLAAGPQRLLDVDWWVAGGVQLAQGPGTIGSEAVPRETGPVGVRMRRPRYVHALMAMQFSVGNPRQSNHAGSIFLVAADGGETELPIMTVRDVAVWWQAENAGPEARVGWLGTSSALLREGFPGDDYAPMLVYAVRLPVPAGIADVAAVRLSASDVVRSTPLFVAVTLEGERGQPPPTAQAPSGSE